MDQPTFKRSDFDSFDGKIKTQLQQNGKDFSLTPEQLFKKLSENEGDLLFQKLGVFELKAPNGNTILGVEGFDMYIQDLLIAKVKNMFKIDVSNNEMALKRIKEAATKARTELSSTSQTEIDLTFLTADESLHKPHVFKLTRSILKSFTNHWLKEKGYSPSLVS